MFSSSQFIHDKLGIKSKIDSSKVLSKPVNGYATPDTSTDKGYSKSSSTSYISETKEDDDGLPNEKDGTIYYADEDSTTTSSTKESGKSTTKKSDKKSDTSDNKSDNHYYY